ncbi:MAG TPA: leucyl aminopeptidase family protein, partial [Flavobacteriales bacterium]|nr:leucyl aminopeptidase family protein [Flavobacteriales bacterium]
MKTKIKKVKKLSFKENVIFFHTNKAAKDLYLKKEELKYISKEVKKGTEIIKLYDYNKYIFVLNPKPEEDKNQQTENLRLIGDKLQSLLKDEEIVVIDLLKNEKKKGLAVVEGLALSNYTFTQHKTDPKPNILKEILLTNISEKEINELQNIVDSVYLTRDLINEPFSHLTAVNLSNEAKKAGKKNGFKVDVFNKKKIESLKMGGLLAVNKGSIDDPTFTIMEWKPKNAKNKQPIVLVGKGIVYDTGGLSLKPTANSMDLMKIDMGGAGTEIGAINAIAANKIPVHVISLTPATDNRPSGNAYAPGDVITMHDGTTVEVLNTDAEGRLVLADALSYAKKYNPELVIDFATLTGAAAVAIGHYGMVSMHKNSEKDHTYLKQSGDKMHERLAEFPFWSDY